MPLEGSPLIDAGISIESIPQEIVGSAPDIGAYEYGAEKWEAGIEGWVPDFYPWSFTIDTDSDGITDTKDNCPNIYNPDQKDENNNGIGDICDSEIDSDGDGINNKNDLHSCVDMVGLKTDKLVTINQVHSSKVLIVNRSGFHNNADGLINKGGNLICAIKVADCLPIFFINNIYSLFK